MDAKIKSSVVWFTLLLYLLGGPLLALFLFSFYMAYPDFLDGVYGFIGLIIFVIPVMVAFLFGVVPLGLLSVLTIGQLTKGVPLRLALPINVACGALLGFLWPYCLNALLKGSESTPSLIDLTAIGSVIALLFTIFCHLYAQRVKCVR